MVAVCTDRVNVGINNIIVPKLRQLAAVGDSPVHILCPGHTLENCAKSADHNVHALWSSRCSFIYTKVEWSETFIYTVYE